MDPLSGDIPTPAGRLIPEVGQAPELPALEEALPDVLDAPLDMGLVLGVTHPCRVGDEAPVLGVLKEATGESGMQCIDTRHRGGEVVDDQVPGDASEELPSRFQACDHLLQSLAACGPDEAVPGVGQYHNQGPHRVTAATLWVVDEPQAPEVHLGHVSGRTRLHPNRPWVVTTPVAALDEPAQGCVGHPAPTLSQQLLDAGQLQVIDGEPAVDLIGPGSEKVIGGCTCPSRAGSADRRQQAELFLGGSRPLLAYPHLPGRHHVFANCISGKSGPRRYVPLAAARLPASDDFCYFHSGHLLVGHRCSSH